MKFKQLSQIFHPADETHRPSIASAHEHVEILKTLLDQFIEEEQLSVTSNEHLATSSDIEGQPKLEKELGTQIEDFLIHCSSSYQLFGCPTHVIESIMPLVAKGLGLKCDFAIFPSHSLISITKKNKDGQWEKSTKYFKTNGGLDMFKLQLLDELVRRISSYSTPEPPRTVKVDEASKKLQLIKQATINSITESTGPTEMLSSQEELSKFRMKSFNTRRSSSVKDVKRTILDWASLGAGFTIASDNQQDKKRAAKYKKAFTMLALEDAIRDLQYIEEYQPLYPFWANLLFKVLASSCCCSLFFSGSWTDFAVTLVSTFLLNLFCHLCQRMPSFSRIDEFVSAFIMANVARYISVYWLPICFKATVFGTIVGSLKGVTMTMAMIELITKNNISGTTRMFYGVVISALIGLGLNVGTNFFANVNHMTVQDTLQNSTCSYPVSQYWYPLLFLVTASSFNLLNNAHYRQLMPLVCGAAFAYGSSFLFSQAPSLDSNISTILSAFIMALFANIHSKYFSGSPPILPILSGLMMMVPGSLAVSIFFGNFTQVDQASGLALASTVIQISIALSVGVFMASLIVPNQDMLRWLLRLEKKKPSQPTILTTQVKDTHLVF